MLTSANTVQKYCNNPPQALLRQIFTKIPGTVLKYWDIPRQALLRQIFTKIQY